MTGDAVPKPTPAREGRSYLGDAVMSNFNHEIHWPVAKRLIDEKVYAQYAGWNFCGYVWWDADADTYRCEVWRWNRPVETLSGTLEDIMDEVCARYGDD